MTSDHYSHLMVGMLNSFKIHWPENPFKIYVVTETLAPSYDDVEVIKIPTKKWSERLFLALKHIESEYIFFFLEDYWITKNVNTELLNEVLKFTLNNKVDFIAAKNDKDYKYFNLNVVNQSNSISFLKINSKAKIYAKYLLNVHGIYKKKFLINQIRINENPWEFEVYSTYRFSNEKIKTSNIYRFNSSLKLFDYIGGTGLITKGFINLSAKYSIYNYDKSFSWTAAEPKSTSYKYQFKILNIYMRFLVFSRFLVKIVFKHFNSDKKHE